MPCPLQRGQSYAVTLNKKFFIQNTKRRLLYAAAFLIFNIRHRMR